MTAYEVIVITKVQADEKKQNDILEKAKTIIADNGGKFGEVQAMGKRPIATAFDKQNQGNFSMLKYEATGPQVNSALNDYLKINEDVIRHMIIKVQERAAIKEPRKAKKLKKTEASAEKAE